MFCSKCGKKILDGDVFCPGCGKKIEWTRYEEPSPEPEMEQPAEEQPVLEKFNFNWNLEDFNHKKTDEVKIEWGDLLDIVKRQEQAASKMEHAEKFDEPKPEPVERKVPEREMAFEQEEKAERRPPAAMFVEPKKEEPEPVEQEPVLEPVMNFTDQRFDTFNRKNLEFQELLEKERQRVKKDKTASEGVSEEIDQWAKEQQSNLNRKLDDVEEPKAEEPEEKEIPAVVPMMEQEPEILEPAVEKQPVMEAAEEPALEVSDLVQEPPKAPEKPLSFFEKRRKKKEEKRIRQNELKNTKEMKPLKLDEDDMNGQWPEKKPEEPVIPVVEKPVEEVKKEEPVKENFYEEPQQESDFSDFLKNMEAELGLSEMPDTEKQSLAAALAAEELVVLDPMAEETEPIEEPIPEVLQQPVAEEEVIVPEVPEKPEVTEPEIPEEPVVMEEQPVEIKAEEPEKVPYYEEPFWDDEKGRGKSGKGSGCGTVIIIILALILAAQIAVLVIRFKFPASDIAQLIEPKLTIIENWLRNLF